MIVDSSLPQSKQVPVSTGTKLFKNKLVLGIVVGVLVFAGLCLIVGIVLIVLFATSIMFNFIYWLLIVNQDSEIMI